MNRISIFALAIALIIPGLVSAQFTGPQGGTGVKGIYAGSIPFGGSSLVRIATSSAFSYNNSLALLTVTNASTTNVSVSGYATGTNLYGFGLSTCNGASQALTYSAGLFGCQTITVAGDGVSNWTFNGTRLTPSTTVGIGVFASSTISHLSSTIATSTDVAVTSLTASRLIASAANKILTSVSNLTSWIAGTTNEITVTDDGDGTVTLSLPSTIDLGGKTSLEIPNGTGPTVDAAGEIAIDTTAGQLKYYDGSSAHILTGTTTRGFNISSSTSGTGGSFSTATTTFLLINDPEPFTLIGWYCQATTTGSVNVLFTDGTNNTNNASCSTGGVTYCTSNCSFTSFEGFHVRIGSSASSPNRVTVSPITSKTSQ